MQEFAELEKFNLAEFGLRLPTKEDYALARAARARAAIQRKHDAEMGWRR